LFVHLDTAEQTSVTSRISSGGQRCDVFALRLAKLFKAGICHSKCIGACRSICGLLIPALQGDQKLRLSFIDFLPALLIELFQAIPRFDLRRQLVAALLGRGVALSTGKGWDGDDSKEGQK